MPDFVQTLHRKFANRGLFASKRSAEMIVRHKWNDPELEARAWALHEALAGRTMASHRAAEGNPA